MRGWVRPAAGMRAAGPFSKAPTMAAVRCPCCGATFRNSCGLTAEAALGMHIDSSDWCKQWMLSSPTHRPLVEQCITAFERSLKPPRGQAGNR